MKIRVGGVPTSFRSVTLKALVTMPQLGGLTVSGASRGIVSNFNCTEAVSIAVSGASRVTGDITAGDIEFDASGASTVQLEGSADDMVAIISGASRFNLGDFAVNNANVNVSRCQHGHH